MKIKDNIYNFSFRFIDYEFNTFTNDKDIYDLNWLVCRYSFIFKDTYISIDDTSLTTFDVLNFISEIEHILSNDKYEQIRLQNIEPDFSMTFISSNIGYRLSIHYNFYYNEVFESIGFFVDMTKEEVNSFLNELKLEISKFPYRRVLDYSNKVNKYKSISDIANTLKNDKLIEGKITYNSTDIVVNKSEFFKIKISDIYCMTNKKYKFSISLNNKPYSYVEEDYLIDELHKLYDDNNLIIEYIFEIGIFKRKWFDIIEKRNIKLNKINKKTLRVFNYNELLYYNKKYITLEANLIEKNKLANLDNKTVRIYLSRDHQKRIQIFKKNDTYSYLFEKLEFREEVEYKVTYNYAYWIQIDDGQSHSYSSVEETEKDILYIIEKNDMFNY